MIKTELEYKQCLAALSVLMDIQPEPDVNTLPSAVIVILSNALEHYEKINFPLTAQE